MEKKGSAMYFALVVLTIILGIVLGMSAMLISQIRIVRGMEHSVIAFHAASTGIEEALRVLPDRFAILPSSLSPTGGFPHDISREILLTGGATTTYQVRMDGGSRAPGGATRGCTSLHYCIRSEGIFRGVRRAIDVRN